MHDPQENARIAARWRDAVYPGLPEPRFGPVPRAHPCPYCGEYETAYIYAMMAHVETCPAAPRES
jgi:hypothetical protein